MTDDATRQKIHGLVEPPDEFPDITTISTVAVLEDSDADDPLSDKAVAQDRRGGTGQGAKRKRRKVATPHFNLPPLDNYRSDVEGSDTSDPWPGR